MSRQTAGLAGIGFALVILSMNVALVAGGVPATDPGRHPDLVRLVAAFAPVAWALSTIFGAGAVVALGPSAWALAGFAGIVLQNLTFTGVMATRLALTSVDEPALRALHDALFVFNGTFLALAMVGLSLAGRHAGLIGRWPGALGLVAAALQFASAVLGPLVFGDPGPIGLLGLAGWLLWVVWLVLYGAALRRPAQLTV